MPKNYSYEVHIKATIKTSATVTVLAGSAEEAEDIANQLVMDGAVEWDYGRDEDVQDHEISQIEELPSEPEGDEE